MQSSSTTLMVDFRSFGLSEMLRYGLELGRREHGVFAEAPVSGPRSAPRQLDA